MKSRGVRPVLVRERVLWVLGGMVLLFAGFVLSVPGWAGLAFKPVPLREPLDLERLERDDCTSYVYRLKEERSSGVPEETGT